MVLIKTNSLGNLTWSRVLSSDESATGRCVVQTADGGYTVAGRVGLPDDCWHARLVRTTSNGDTLWTKTLEPLTGAESCQETSDGGFIMSGDMEVWKLGNGQ